MRTFFTDRNAPATDRNARYDSAFWKDMGGTAITGLFLLTGFVIGLHQLLKHDKRLATSTSPTEIADSSPCPKLTPHFHLTARHQTGRGVSPRRSQTRDLRPARFGG
jgi:hypothetical protein